MPYPENFVVRLIVCIIGMLAIWIGVRFILDVVISHEEFVIRPISLAIPVVLGVVEAFVWKPKDKNNDKAQDK
ncbi:MAG: hypothetical protein IKF78_15815 [Atopobiaceae bacterium]|nr:hypothetical protein [Atopobiaceae bacterium]